MNAVRNPFHPTFGIAPPVLVGRDSALLDFDQGIGEGPGSPWRAIKLVGPRGVGKTTLLSAFGQRECVREWIRVDTTTGPEMLDDIWDQARVATQHLVNRANPGRTVIAGVGLSILGIGGSLSTHRPADDAPLGWRARMEALLDLLAEHSTGLLITIDEVHDGVPELERFAKTFQHFVRDGREVAVVFAGLPGEMSKMATTPGLTFIWRAEQIELGAVDEALVRHAFRQTIEDNGRTIDAPVLRTMSQATEGYPFLIQLVGYHVWRAGSGTAITAADVTAGVPVAKRRLGSTVHAMSLRDLSDVDKTFLVKMAVDTGSSKVSEIARRMDVDARYVSVYRARLIEAGMIEPAGFGTVRFAIPYLGEYLREHGASLVWRER